MEITIPGDPIAKARARTVRRGKISMSYDPQQVQKEYCKNFLKWKLKTLFESNDKEILIELNKIASAEFFSVDIESYMPIPKSLSKHKRKALEGDCIYHNKKPDGDNLMKFVFDCANGILFKDDSQIVKGSFEKIYSSNPRTVININVLK